MASAEEGNQVIRRMIKAGYPFIATKMGTVEQGVIYSSLGGCGYSGIRRLASDNAGITPNDDDTLMEFSKEYIKGLSNINVLALMHNPNEQVIISLTCPGRLKFELRCLEPFYFTEPWSEMLYNKRVLVIHPFEESIIGQYSKRELLFADKAILPEFKLLTIKAEQTHGGGTDGCKPFFESLAIMRAKMDAVDYDIALIGCGAYGLLLADHAKRSGKQAVHIGGGLQILFGIKGGRWDCHPEISAMYNEHWVRPLDSEKPRHHMVVENGTYW